MIERFLRRYVAGVVDYIEDSTVVADYKLGQARVLGEVGMLQGMLWVIF